MRCLPALLVLSLFASLFAEDPPRVLDDRLQLELFAEHPTLVTPTGIDVDHRGRIFVIESNTHFPPDGYQGHSSDRLWILADTDGDHRADQHTLFADGLKHAMSVAVKPLWVEGLGLRAKRQKNAGDAATDSVPQPLALSPEPLTVFVATRREILLLTDTDGDSKADERTQLVHLETKGDYPHNGLAGFAFDALGNMFFGFGENLGADYQIIGSDGVTLKGGGEGGNIYRCRPDGSKLERWATGFWNPHASCFDAFGRMFTVDNDPDSRPPCRLLHIIQGGDYGYRFRNGRKGTHPFTAWNGELPGTLPMVAGTGEAPSGIVCYEAEGFPDDYLGTLLVGSWGDHRIDQFVLQPKGASFTSVAKPIVQGDENFRPVGLALAPDGSLFFSDWVLKDYKLHGKGRVWRLSAKGANKHVGTVELVSKKTPVTKLRDHLRSRSLTVRRLAAQVLAFMPEESDYLKRLLRDADESSRARIETLWAISRVPTDIVNHHLGSTASEFTAPLGGRFDEMIVAAMSLLGTPQFVALERAGPLEFRYYVDPKCTRDAPRDLVAQLLVQIELSRPDRLWPEWTQLHTDLKISTDETLDRSDPFLLSSQRTQLSNRFAQNDGLIQEFRQHKWFSDHFMSETIETSRLSALLAARASDPQRSPATVRLGLTDESPMVRRAAVQWVGEERLPTFRWLIDAMMAREDTTPDLLLACLATLSLLDGVPASEFEKTPPTQYALAMVKDDARPAALRATALRMIPASSPELPSDLLVRLAQSTDAGLQLEAVRTLQQSSRPEAIPVLLKIVANPQANVELRCEALGGLCATPHELPLPPEVEQQLLTLAAPRLPIRGTSDELRATELLQIEAIRALRGRAKEGTKIARTLSEVRESASEKRELLEAIDLALGKTLSVPQPLALDPQPSDSIDAGRRVFFHHQGPLCSKCHQVQGRGGNVGPDLSTIARTMSREKLWQSIVEPSKEISPQYVTWVVLTTDGKVHQGIAITENGAGDLDLGDAQGRVTKIPRKEIEERAPSKVSTMPEGLTKQFTSQEARDLLAYLMSLK